MDKKYKQVATTEDVTQQIAAIASQILKDFPTKSPLFIALLRGAAPFSSKLMTELAKQNRNYHPELDYMMVST